MTNVVVIGGSGRLGGAAAAGVAAADDLVLTSVVSRSGAVDAGEASVVAALGDLDPSTVDVIVDMTLADAARSHLAWAAEHGVHAVVGVTGFSDAELDGFAADFTDSHCLIVPNFAIGAVLMMRFAELAAPWFDTVEVVEMHHDGKRDAPSGTARSTAQRIAAASSDWAPDPTEEEVVAGARGGRVDGVPVHSLRMRGMVAHQEVVFGTTGQALTIRHDSTHHSSFVPGVLAAVRSVGSLGSGLTVGLDAVMGI